jgi:HPr kinase/phosphorylase
MVHLKPLRDGEQTDGLTRLTGDVGHRELLDVQVPSITLPVAPGRNLSVLVEAAVRSHMLKSKGIDPAQTFIDRQAHQLQRLPPW